MLREKLEPLLREQRYVMLIPGRVGPILHDAARHVSNKVQTPINRLVTLGACSLQAGRLREVLDASKKG